MNKRELYYRVECLRQRFGIKRSPPYDSPKLCTEVFGLNLDFLDLRTYKLRGMSHIPSRSIVIDEKRPTEEQNFHCMHEIMHHMLHCNKATKTYSSYEETQADQDPFIEWQANEGAAQFLVPYQLFIPEYLMVSRKYARNAFPDIDTEEFLAEKYFVSSKVIHNRIDSLNYEIYQYMDGVPIEKIKLCSKYYLKSHKWNLNHQRHYCKKCLAPFEESDKYCSICGGILNNGRTLHRLGFTGKGAGYMVFEGRPQDEKGRIIKCPICENEQAYEEGEYCIICGSLLVNKCADTDVSQDGFTSRKLACNVERHLPGNARFCPYCGNETTYFQQNFLPPWVKEDDTLPF